MPLLSPAAPRWLYAAAPGHSMVVRKWQSATRREAAAGDPAYASVSSGMPACGQTQTGLSYQKKFETQKRKINGKRSTKMLIKKQQFVTQERVGGW